MNSLTILYDIHHALAVLQYNIATRERHHVVIDLLLSNSYRLLLNKVFVHNVVVTALNNYAAYAQDIGAIVPYDITVTVKTTFTE